MWFAPAAESMTEETRQFEKPDSQAATALVNTETRERWELNADTKITVGRAEDNLLSLKNDVYASGHHAEIFISDNLCYVKDLDSTNGTYLNNQPLIGSVTVEPGDIITFGRTRFEIQ